MSRRPTDPTQKTLNRLFGVAGNCCAFSGCTEPLFDPASGAFMGTVCHIKAASSGGPRYDPGQTDDERRAFENLVLMCKTHGGGVDDHLNMALYPVELLQEMKAGRERWAPDVSIKLELHPVPVLFGQAPAFQVALRASNQGRRPADSYTFEIRLPFLPPRLWKRVGTDQVIQPVMGRATQTSTWVPFLDLETNTPGLRFNSPPEARLRPDGGSHILCLFHPIMSWYALRPGSNGPEPLKSEIEPRPAVVAYPYALEFDPAERRSGSLELNFYELIDKCY